VLLALVLTVAAQRAPPRWPVSPLFADPGMRAALGSIDPKPGAWAEYLVRAPGKGDLRVRATVLAAADDGRYWLELATAGESGLASAAKLLVHGNAFSLGDVERLYVMIAGQQPIEVPLDEVRPGRAKPPAEAQRVERLRPERVRVAAGEFNADVFRASGTRIWRAAGVPLWGLVKARSARQSMELVASGTTGGHSLFPPGWDQGKGSESRK
jgi:hypothetical protein